MEGETKCKSNGTNEKKTKNKNRNEKNKYCVHKHMKCSIDFGIY